MRRKSGRKAWKPNRYPFCGCKLDKKGKRIEKCPKHAEAA